VKENPIFPTIEEVNLEEVLIIRHEVMWPNKPFDYVKLPNDKSGKHFGLRIDRKLVSIVSVFENDNKIQFRKLATIIEFQGNGYGTKLIQHIIELGAQQKCISIWCNARVEKTGFYLKFGFKETKNRFKKGGVDYVIMEKTFENPSSTEPFYSTSVL